MTRPTNYNEKIIEEFRANGGKVGGNFANSTLLLLHTKGAKTGEERVNPLAYHQNNGRLVIIASKGGAPNNPNWYHNLIANPIVELEVGTETYQAEATVAPEPERTALYDERVTTMPGFGEYRTKTTRTIPVITLKRIP
jgi:deazaflavin-dependent oxidoreductase (nitroreductase family)